MKKVQMIRMFGWMAMPCLAAAADAADHAGDHAGAARSAAGTSAPVPVAVMYHDKFLAHDTGAQHPERAERLRAVVGRLRDEPALTTKLRWPAFGPAPDEALAAVHSRDYVALVEREVAALGKDGRGVLSTGDTMISPGTLEAAKLAAGAGMAACDEVMAGRASSGLALVRPPGHHATRSRGMGFCVFNNIALAARHLQKAHGLKQILIVDFDVHHGNGTQDIFEDDDSVFYFSIHQHPLYPGSGRPSEIGTGQGTGFTLNVELPPGAHHDAALAAIDRELVPAMRKFKPQFVLVSAGFDAHAGDPLGGLRYTDDGYAALAGKLVALADDHAQGRIVLLLEGGYALRHLADSVAAVAQVLANRK